MFRASPVCNPDFSSFNPANTHYLACLINCNYGTDGTEYNHYGTEYIANRIQTVTIFLLLPIQQYLFFVQGPPGQVGQEVSILKYFSV